MLKLPKIIERNVTATTVALLLSVTPEIEFFNGHFDGFPILPGVALLGWVVHFAAECLKVNDRVHGLDAIKFLRPIRPGMQVRLEIGLVKKSCIEFVCLDGSGKIASGKLLLEAP